MKGEVHMNMLMGIILGGTLLLVAIAIGLLLRNSFLSFQDDAPCATEILTHKSLNELTGSKTAIEINCPTKLITLEKPNDEYLKSTIAKEMARCWRMWGKGQYELFKDQDGLYCHVCSLIEVQGVNTVQGFPEYLRTEKISGQTYAEYIAGVKVGEYFDEAKFKEHTQDQMTTENGLGVVFYYAKGSTFVEKLVRTTAGNPSVGLAAGGVLVGSVFATGGASIPVVITAGLAGANIGFITSLTLRPEEYQRMSGVVVRPLQLENVREIGCTSAPVTER